MLPESAMRVKIIQVDIGTGSQWAASHICDVIREVCIPSVKNYSELNGYDYELITSSTYKERIGQFDFLMTHNKHYAFERYLHLDTDYDWIAYIDNDIYISDFAKSMPLKKGLLAVSEPGHPKNQILFSQLNNLPENTPYFNSGFFIADRDSAKALGDYMIFRARNHIKAKGKSTDNMMFNEYLIHEHPLFNALSEKWNYMPMLPGSTKGLRANFLHLVGIDGKRFLGQLLKTGSPLKDLLENITTGKLHIEL